jgi:hypothetical protein
MRRIVMVAALAAVGIFGSLLGTAGATSSGPTVVMSGLDNPRGLAVSGRGEGWRLYVAEAGEGGAGPCVSTGDPARPVVCYGPTGAITVLRRGEQRRIVSGMPSNAVAGGADASGPHDISLRGGKYVTIGMGGNPALRAGFGAGGSDFAKVVRLRGDGWRPVADIAAHEAASNPDNGPLDTNPYGLLQSSSGRILTDAGGNSLLRFGRSGTVSTVAVFPSRADGRPTDAVPTSVVRGPDGHLYVGELTGAPFAPGAARIYRVVGGTAEVWQEGFTTIVDMAFACDRTLYVLQHSSLAPFFGGPGEVVRLEPNGSRSTAVTGLQRPTSIVIGPDGNLYISNRGNEPNVGEVLRISIDEHPCHKGDHNEDDEGDTNNDENEDDEDD